MALDLQALRQKLQDLNGNKSKADILWKPAEGDNLVRIVPLAATPDNPFTELYFHYLGGKTYLSPVTFGEPDPIAEFAEMLRAGGNLTKDEWKETKKFVPQIRTYVPVIDRNKPQQGVRFWAFGKTVYQELLAVIADPDYGDITDPQNGRDIKVNFTPQEKSDTNYAKTAIRISPKQTPLTKDADQLKSWLTEQPDLMSLYKKHSYDELKKILDNFVNGTVTPKSSDDDWGEEAVQSPTASKSNTTKKVATKDVEDEFSALFDE